MSDDLGTTISDGGHRPPLLAFGKGNSFDGAVVGVRRANGNGLAQPPLLCWTSIATLVAMSSVVFFRAVNVGGYQKFQPGKLAKELAEFGVVNIGAAGTFVVREN